MVSAGFRPYSTAARVAAGMMLGVGMAPAVAQTFTGLGFLPGEGASGAWGVSDDGNTAAGDGEFTAFRWTAGGGMVSLGMLPGGVTWSEAWATSADGSVVVGSSDSANGRRAYRWTKVEGMVDLGTLPGGTFSRAIDISSDGSVIVGWSDSAGTDRRAFRWTSSGGMQDLGVLPDHAYSSLWGVSRDGTTAVGRSVSSENTWQAVRWTSAGGMQPLGVVASMPESDAYGANGDGSVIVGAIFDATTFQGFRWTQGGGIRPLGVLPGGTYSEADKVSADGMVVVGLSESANGPYRATLWNPVIGLVDLNEYLPTLGINLAGWELLAAFNISSDGRFIVGIGDHNGLWEAFVAQIPAFCYADCNGDGSLNLADFGCFQTKFAVQDLYADCNGDGVHNIADFGCFQTKFALGCP